MRSSSLSANRQLGLELVLVLLLGGASGYVLVLFSSLAAKWLVFVILALLAAAGVIILPQRERLFLGVAAFAVAINLDFNPYFALSPLVRPVYGTNISLFDIPLTFLVGIWLVRLAAARDRKLHLYPWLTLPFLAIFGLVLPRTLGSTQDPVLIYWTLLLVLKNWLVFIYLANNVDERDKLKLVLLGLLAMTVAHCCLGLAQWATGGEVGLGILGEMQSEMYVHRTGEFTISRVVGTFGSPNSLATHLGLFIPVTLALIFAPVGKGKRFILLVALALMLAVEALTYSRGGWASLTLGGGLTLYWCLIRKTRRRFVSGLLLVTFLAVTIITALSFSERIRGRLFLDDFGAARVRQPLMQVAFDIIQAYPLLGVGIGEYAAIQPYFDTTKEHVSVEFPYPVHNEWLLLAAEAGIPAAALFVAIFIGILILCLRLARSGDPLLEWLGVGLFGGFIAWILANMVSYEYALLDLTLWFLFGLVQAAANLSHKEPRPVKVGS